MWQRRKMICHHCCNVWTYLDCKWGQAAQRLKCLMLRFTCPCKGSEVPSAVCHAWLGVQVLLDFLSPCSDRWRRCSPPIILITEWSRTPFSGGINPSGKPGYHPGFTSATFPIPCSYHPNMKKPEILIRFQYSLLGFLWSLPPQDDDAG